jgi:hypothetical protein
MDKIRTRIVVVGWVLLGVMLACFFAAMLLTTAYDGGVTPVTPNPIAKGGQVMPVTMVVLGVLVLVICLGWLISFALKKFFGSKKELDTKHVADR